MVQRGVAIPECSGTGSRIANLGVLIALALGLAGCGGSPPTTITTTTTSTGSPPAPAGIAIGRKMQIWKLYSEMVSNESSVPEEVNIPGLYAANSAVRLPGIGLALSGGFGSAEWRLYVVPEPLGQSEVWSVGLNPITFGKGAVVFDGMVYVVGDGQEENVSSMVKVDPIERKVVANFKCPDVVEKIYVFVWNGKQELFIATDTLGLVRFDPASLEFDTTTTKDGLPGNGRARSAVQQSDDVFFVLTDDRLIRLEKKEASSESVLEAVAETTLPNTETSSDSSRGVDVILGLTTDTLFATQQTDTKGKLYYYTYEDGNFALVNTLETGNSTYTTIDSTSGDIITCNPWDDATLMVYQGLGKTPTVAEADLDTVVIHTADEMLSVFLMEVISSPPPPGSDLASAFYW